MQVKLVCTDLVALARSRPDRHFRKSHCQALGMSLYGSFLPGRPKADLTSSFGCVRFGSKPEKLNASKCLPLCPQERT
jgi:hypothetical protein